MARCPAHVDLTPSLSIRETANRTLLLKCFAGCTAEDVMDAIELPLATLFPSSYALAFNKDRPIDRAALDDQVRSQPTSDVRIDRARQAAMTARHRRSLECDPYDLNELANELSLPVKSLKRLSIGIEGRRYLFAERDDQGKIVGLLRRDPGGARKCAYGSVRGLTIPRKVARFAGPIYVAEGATDVAALLSLDLNAIGRPAARASAAVVFWLVRFLRQYPGRQIIILGDNDPSRRGVRVGRRGARELATRLKDQRQTNVRWALPAVGFKDVREQIVSGAWRQGLKIMEVER
jgi:phage/plasmid primase-like uncharacterized protein